MVYVRLIALVVGFQNIQTEVSFINKHGVHVAFNQPSRNSPAHPYNEATGIENQMIINRLFFVAISVTMQRLWKYFIMQFFSIFSQCHICEVYGTNFEGNYVVCAIIFRRFMCSPI